MNFPPDTGGPGGGYETNSENTCVKNPSIRTLVETFPILMAVGGVIPDEAALLLLTKSVVFDRQLYQLHANAGKDKKKPL